MSASSTNVLSVPRVILKIHLLQDTQEQFQPRVQDAQLDFSKMRREKLLVTFAQMALQRQQLVCQNVKYADLEAADDNTKQCTDCVDGKYQDLNPT